LSNHSQKTPKSRFKSQSRFGFAHHWTLSLSRTVSETIRSSLRITSWDNVNNLEKSFNCIKHCHDFLPCRRFAKYFEVLASARYCTLMEVTQGHWKPRGSMWTQQSTSRNVPAPRTVTEIYRKLADRQSQYFISTVFNPLTPNVAMWIQLKASFARPG